VPRMQQNSKEGEEHSYGKILAYWVWRDPVYTPARWKLRRKPGDRLSEDKHVFITVFVLDFVQNPSCSFLLH
jgi:hypothetical protein